VDRAEEQVKGRGFIFAVLVLGLLAAAVFGVKLRDEQEGKLKQYTTIFPHSTYAAQQIRLELPATDRWASFRRTSDGWVVEQGSKGARADFAADLLSAWSQVRYIDTVDEEPTEEDLERYGLAEPQCRLEARIQNEEGESESLSVVVGGPAPLTDGIPKYYAQLNSFRRVVLVQATAGDLFQGVGREVLGLEPLVQPGEGRPRRP
jgi:hypothetical protein